LKSLSQPIAVRGDISIVMKMEMSMHFMECIMKLPAQRGLSTLEFEGLPEPGHASLEMATFEELPGSKTWVMTKAVFQSVADRDGMVQSGMEKGVNDSHDRLDELLAKMQK
jgi:hypothetical protein